MGNGNAKNDLEKYRASYPDLLDDSTINDNYMFYAGKISSDPDGDYIDKIHENWWGDTEKLEFHHGYIQWLFPIREHGMNYKSKPLQKHEIEKIKNSPECMARFVKSYELMLHFYGCCLKNKETGELERHEGWKAQYTNLNIHSHNYLRITRILKSLGELGLEHYKKPFLEHFIQEIWVNKELPNCELSCETFWVGTIKDDNHRKELEQKIATYTKPKRGNHQLHMLSNRISSSRGIDDDDDDDDDSSRDEDVSTLDEETKKKYQDEMLKDDEEGDYVKYDDDDIADGTASRQEDDDGNGDKDDD